MAPSALHNAHVAATRGVATHQQRDLANKTIECTEFRKQDQRAHRERCEYAPNSRACALPAQTAHTPGPGPSPGQKRRAAGRVRVAVTATCLSGLKASFRYCSFFTYVPTEQTAGPARSGAPRALVGDEGARGTGRHTESKKGRLVLPLDALLLTQHTQHMLRLDCMQSLGGEVGLGQHRD
eukprot:scaffold202505_cov28-Tisochrysis_lutea.AAC.3